MSRVVIFRESCKGMEGCGICAYVCPKGLFVPGRQMNAAGYLPPEPIDETECTACLNCMIYCPDMAVVAEKGLEEGGEENHDVQR